MVVRFRPSDAPPHTHSLCDQLLKPEHSDRNGKLTNDQDRLIQIQNPIVRRGGFLQVAVSEAPLHSASER
jgi:hypothetical protein